MENQKYGNESNSDKTPNTGRNENREDKDNEFDENVEKEEEFLEKDQKRERQNPDSGNTSL